MGNSKANLADKFIKRAEKDLRSAKVLRDEDCFEDACYHAQQCGEKAIKAHLILKGSFATTHTPSPTFLREIQDAPGRWKDELLKVQEKMEELEGYWIKTRYPDEEWREYDREETDEAIEKAEFILDRIKKFLEEKYAY